MTPETKQLLEIIIEAKKGMSLTEIVGLITGVIVCLVTTYAFIRSVIKAGFDKLASENKVQSQTLEKQESVLNKINSTLTTVRVDCVTHDVCAKRQHQLCRTIGIQELKERVTKVEDRLNDKDKS